MRAIIRGTKHKEGEMDYLTFLSVMTRYGYGYFKIPCNANIANDMQIIDAITKDSN